MSIQLKSKDGSTRYDVIPSAGRVISVHVVDVSTGNKSLITTTTDDMIESIKDGRLIPLNRETANYFGVDFVDEKRKPSFVKPEIDFNSLFSMTRLNKEHNIESKGVINTLIHENKILAIFCYHLNQVLIQANEAKKPLSRIANKVIIKEEEKYKPKFSNELEEILKDASDMLKKRREPSPPVEPATGVIFGEENELKDTSGFNNGMLEPPKLNKKVIGKKTPTGYTPYYKSYTPDYNYVAIKSDSDDE